MPGIAQILRAAIKTLPGDSAWVDAELLLAHALEKSRVWLYAHADEAMPEPAARQFDTLIARRCTGEPIAYLLGHKDFWKMQLEVTRDTLIPRAETELLVELALKKLAADRPLQVLDLGTGSGAIALAIASERPRAQVTAIDASAEALQVAQRNARRLGLGNCRLLQSQWFEQLQAQRFDMIVSNPPYIAASDAHLTQGDLRFEPQLALASGVDGLDAIRSIVEHAPAHLLPAASLLIEHGFDQGAAVRQLFLASGLVQVHTVRDLEDRERTTVGDMT